VHRLLAPTNVRATSLGFQLRDERSCSLGISKRNQGFDFCWPGWRWRSSAAAATASCRCSRVACSQSSLLGHHSEHGFAFGVGVVHGLVAGGQGLLPAGFLMLALAAGGVGLGAGADDGQAGFHRGSLVLVQPGLRARILAGSASRPGALIKTVSYPPAGPMRARLAISDQNERIWLARNPCQGAVLRPIRGRRTSMYW
jgi:hypothetical protein